MEQTRIYKPGQEQLHELLRQASDSQGATLLIPDLQRPFRWSPGQVTLLVDSLMRGWPFGTLLLWAMDDQKVAEIPSRPFWRLVDRMDPEKGTTAAPMDPPASRGFRMVLDGQQRLQSLIVALGGGDAGFKLEDREWWASGDPDRAKGRAAMHWSKGVLCLDLEDYLGQHGALGGAVQHVDYTRALKWVVCAARDGRSEFKKPVNYEVPIPDRTDTPGKFIQLARLWGMAQVGAPSTGALMKQIKEELLAQGVAEPKVNDAVGPLLDLVLGFGKVKETEVSFLELQPIQRKGFNAEQYDDAVVNIFTRLNAGGRALSEEEITFAWIKRNWQPKPPDTIQATPAFEQLQRDMRDEGVALGMDKLVQAVSVIWAILEREGKLLRPSDLLKGDKVGPLAAAVSQRWSALAGNLVETARLLRELGLAHGDQYESLNAFIALAAWRYVGIEWLAQSKAKVVAEHNVNTRLDTLLKTYAGRFLVLTSWAGQWQGAATRFQQYAEELAQEYANGRGANETALLEGLEARLLQWISECVPHAVAYVKGLQAGRREDVRWYYVPLWVWHRLDLGRRRASEGLNLPKSRAKLSIDVDHIVSYASWQNRLSAGEGPQAWENDVNLLGNCFLLEKNFNISKQEKPLGEFLDKVEALAEPQKRLAWVKSMGLPLEMVDSAPPSLEDLRACILERTDQIKADLVAFVTDEVGLAEDGLTVPVSGEWTTSCDEAGEAKDVTLWLQQDGNIVTGRYGETGMIEGTFSGTHLSGSWSETGYSGAFAWWFASDGTSFDGTWGMRKKSSGSGGWRGKRNS